LVTACTIIARNYLAHARVLAGSFFAHHPDGSFTVLLIDDEKREFDDSRESFRCMRLSDIGLDRDEIGRLAALYNVTALATAVKPPFLRTLLDEGLTDLIYLDPDIKIYGSLEEVADLARQHAIVVIPHMTAPFPRDGRRITDFDILAAGIYNLGFIAVASGTDAFIDWWWQRTRREAHTEPLRMMFTDQRWVDFVPSFFEHFIFKDPSYNVAYWNLHSREFAWNGHAYLVDGKPLTFFHFSGFDSNKPYLLSKHQGDRPRILLSECQALARICAEYRKSLELAGVDRESALSYGWNELAPGIPFDRWMRRLYREELEAYEEGKRPEPANPFENDMAERFLDWLNEPAPVGLRSGVSRYLYAIYQDRADLQRAFPYVPGRDRAAYFEWVLTDGVEQVKIPKQLLPARPAEFSEDTYVPSFHVTEGVNLAGYFRGEVGVGEAARHLMSTLEAAGIPHSTVSYDATPSRKAHPFVERGDGRAPHDINVVCVNADQTPRFARDAGAGFFDGRYTAGYWFWELEDFPPTMHGAFEFVDEVWTATQFVAGGVRAIGRRPVYTIPLPVPIPRFAPNVTRDSLRLPPGFMFLFVFDFFSVLERKNPIGLINAFERAFRPGEGPILVIKTINGHMKLVELEKVRAAASPRPDIFVVDEYYSAAEKNSLLGLCDCYVSLHRSEGLGLTMAEAMALEKPVIGTAYSGNLDFMTPDNSYLVDYVRSAVPPGCDPYPKGSAWAEPDLGQAAEYMQRVYRSPDEARLKAQRAREDIVTKHNVDVTAVLLKQRLEEIRRTRSRSGVGETLAADRTLPAKSSQTPELEEVDSLSSLDRIVPLLTPTATVAPDRRFRRPLLAAQRLLFRILRPYWWQQRAIQASLIDGLREVKRAVDSEHQQRQALASLWTAVHAIGQSLRAVETKTPQEGERLIPLEAAISQFGEFGSRFQSSVNAGHQQQQGLESLWTAVHAIEQTLRAVEERMGSFGDSTSSFQSSAATHLKALTDQLEIVTAQASTLSSRLYAVPYMDERSPLSYTDEQGSHVLGFRSKRAVEADVYAGFEDIFRGNEAFIRERFHVYLPLLQTHDRVVEIGCGRGELLDLLREAGVPAIGVDIDPGMVRRCRAKGHTVEEVDGIGYLRAQDDSSVPVIFAAQLVEHLTYDDLISFLQLSRAKLKSGGQLIFETVNPHALEAFKTFWTDLTHQRPIFPEVAVAWCWLLGFDQAYVFFPNGVGDLVQDRTTRGEYAVVATKE
jgi:glycosyltransferase involved in cell wall biosynthesis/2-polyprenyl-3-methyl-5-hydroxy-6-metoxy-1,4-benzoquinol methylase